MVKTISVLSIESRDSSGTIRDDMVCYTPSTNSKWYYECANGNLGKNWDGCTKQGSVRIRCPKGRMPCNQLLRNKTEFSCFNDCTSHGGVKECIEKGSIFPLAIHFDSVYL